MRPHAVHVSVAADRFAQSRVEERQARRYSAAARPRQNDRAVQCAQADGPDRRRHSVRPPVPRPSIRRRRFKALKNLPTVRSLGTLRLTCDLLTSNL